MNVAGTRMLLRNSGSALRIQSKTHLASYAMQKRGIVTLKDTKFTAHATARGQGRNGEVNSDDDVGISLRLAMPKALGGNGEGQNPEQLFAMGYSACLLGAIQMVAGQQGKTEGVRDAAVHAQVHIGEAQELGGFGLAVDLQVEGIQDEELIRAGHEACPYSRALKHGITVNVTKK